MINNVYFQNEIIKEFLNRDENQWLGDVSWEAQVRYLRIVGTLIPDDVRNGSKMDDVRQLIIADTELG
jgi:hypothetical protein